MIMTASGTVFRVEVLIKGSAAYDDVSEIIERLTAFSNSRRMAGESYLTWVAHGAVWGNIENDLPAVHEMLSLSAQTHPGFHANMDRFEFNALVGEYVDYMVTMFGLDIMYVNFLPPHCLAVYEKTPGAGGRTTA